MDGGSVLEMYVHYACSERAIGLLWLVIYSSTGFQVEKTQYDKGLH